MVRASTEKTLLNIGIIGALAAAVYFVYVTWIKKAEVVDVYDPCANIQGLPKWFCMFGDFILGYQNCMPGFDLACMAMGGTYDTNTCMCSEKVEHVPAAVDEHGCLIDTQQWCSRDNQCRDIAMACTPAPETRPSDHPECYEWIPRLGIWLWSNSYCPYVPSVPTPVAGKTKSCPDGTYIYPDETCPVYIPPVAKKSCTCNGIIHELSEAEAAFYGSCGNYCDSLIKTNIVDCSCGKIDLNNPPGTTCENACAGWVPVPIPVPVPSITCYPGGYTALANRPGNCGGRVSSEAACIALCGGGSTYYPENGSCVSAGQRQLDAYRDACGWM